MVKKKRQKKKTRNYKKSKGWLFWTPRILGIIFILFISMFALDVFEGYDFPMVLVALFMHLIPSFILLILLLIAWREDKIGGILYLVLGVIFTIFFRLYQDFISFLLIALPVFIVGTLFLLNHYKRR